MKLTNIHPQNLTVKINDLWRDQWFLLTAGDFTAGNFNTMTVAWGFLGIMWNKPIAAAVVRPSRYTWQFIEKQQEFTLCAFPEEFHKDMSLLGSKSGRDSNKLAETSLTPVASETVKAPGFAEAELILECRNIYYTDFQPENFRDNSIMKNYPHKDYHRMYFGKIIRAAGTEKYSGK